MLPIDKMRMHNYLYIQECFVFLCIHAYSIPKYLVLSSYFKQLGFLMLWLVENADTDDQLDLVTEEINLIKGLALLKKMQKEEHQQTASRKYLMLGWKGTVTFPLLTVRRALLEKVTLAQFVGDWLWWIIGLLSLLSSCWTIVSLFPVHLKLS